MMGFFRQKQVAKAPAYKAITFGGWRYTPQPDITAYELSLLALVFGNIMHRQDIKPYIEQNNLVRHFQIDAQ